MPVRVPVSLPAVEALRAENIFVIDEQRASTVAHRYSQFDAVEDYDRDRLVASHFKHTFASGT